MESWMIIVLIIGAVIMFSFWGLMALGKKELKKREQVNQRYVDKNQPDAHLADWSPRNPDDEDSNARYDSNGRRIN